MQANSFGHWLRLKRKSLDLTREGLADRVGCAAATIRKIETEERRPSAQIVERLAEIFGIPASERADFLHFARGGQRAAISDTAEELPWRKGKDAFPGNIPAPVTSFIGRERDLALVCGYLSSPEIRLITLVGPPGIGKTRLSIEAGRACQTGFPEGVFFVPLAALEAGLVASAIAQTLGYVEKRLFEGIGKKHILFILDNCEHMVETIAVLVADLLTACPFLKILATSREALRVPGEWLYSVPPLGTPQTNLPIEMNAASRFPALELFAERARAVRSDFALNPDNIQAVASICAQLDGLPLAIELIAARVRVMSPQALLQRLSNQFVLSADGMRAVPARQKTLNNAIGWSYSLLAPEEQKALAWLSVFAGGFTMDAAEAVLGSLQAESAIPDLVASLADKSLLQRSIGTCEEIRFGMLVTIQQFALNSLRRMDGEQEARNRHLAYFLALAEKGEIEMRGPSQVEWADRLESEHNNFRGALEWAVSTRNTESALRLLRALGWPWEVRGHYSDAHCWLDEIRTLPNLENYGAEYASALNHIGRHSWTQGNIEDARALLLESQRIAQELGEDGELLLADALNWLGLVVLYGNRDAGAAKSMFERALALNTKWGNKRGVALSTFHLGIAEIDKNESAAFSLLEQSLATFDRFGDLFFIARVSDFLGELCLKQGNLDRAKHLFEQRLRNDKEVRFWDGIVEGWFDLGNLHFQQGHYDQASQCFEESVFVCDEHSLNKFEPFYMSGVAALSLDDCTLAFQRFMHLLAPAQKEMNKGKIGAVLAGLSRVAGGTNQPERAARLNGAAQSILEAFDFPYHPKNHAGFERFLQIARQQLGNDIFDALQAEGRAMTLEQAVDYACSR